MIRLLTALLVVALGGANTTDDVLYDDAGNVQYAYYRMDNFNTQRAATTDQWRADWNTTYSIFDSPQEVHVVRYDAWSSDEVSLGGSSAYLKLSGGAAFFFTTSSGVTMTDMTTGTSASSFDSSSMGFATSGACVALSVAPSSTSGSNASVVVITSGEFEEVGFDEAMAEVVSDCEEASFLVGYDDMHNNPVDYEVAGECEQTLAGPGGADDYDNLDAPIGPLASHYHTRGALYFNAEGTSSYDTGVTELVVGELRFVQAGYYYGPETMDPWPGSVVLSLHEPDPTAIVVSTAEERTAFAKKQQADAKYTPCSFACLDTPGTTSTTMTCVNPDAATA